MRGYLDETTKKIMPINQIEAEELGLPDYEFDVAYNGELYLKGYAPEKPQEEKEKEVRAIRDSLLSEQDKYMIEDFPITEYEKETRKVYRTYLRNYPNNPNWFENNPMTFDEWKISDKFTPPRL